MDKQQQRNSSNKNRKTRKHIEIPFQPTIAKTKKNREKIFRLQTNPTMKERSLMLIIPDIFFSHEILTEIDCLFGSNWNFNAKWSKNKEENQKIFRINFFLLDSMVQFYWSRIFLISCSLLFDTKVWIVKAFNVFYIKFRVMGWISNRIGITNINFSNLRVFFGCWHSSIDLVSQTFNFIWRIGWTFHNLIFSFKCYS